MMQAFATKKRDRIDLPNLASSMSQIAPHLERFRDLCDQIAKGDYEAVDALFDLTVDSDMPAELQQLAENFGSMIVQVEAREFRLNNLLSELQEANRQLEAIQEKLEVENIDLRKQVKKLRIEIDQGQKELEVSEIVDTDYFRDLQKKARELRARQKG